MVFRPSIRSLCRGPATSVIANNLLGSDYIDGVYAFDPEGELEGGDNVDLVFTDLSIAGVLAFDPEGDLEAGDNVDLVWTQTQLTYQHYQDGVAIDGATGDVLSLTDIDETANGSYTLRATNPITGKFKLFGPLVIDGVSGGGEPPAFFKYKRPGGTDDYKRPDATSYYKRP